MLPLVGQRPRLWPDVLSFLKTPILRPGFEAPCIPLPYLFLYGNNTEGLRKGSRVITLPDSGRGGFFVAEGSILRYLNKP